MKEGEGFFLVEKKGKGEQNKLLIFFSGLTQERRKGGKTAFSSSSLRGERETDSLSASSSCSPLRTGNRREGGGRREGGREREREKMRPSPFPSGREREGENGRGKQV